MLGVEGGAGAAEVEVVVAEVEVDVVQGRPTNKRAGIG